MLSDCSDVVYTHTRASKQSYKQAKSLNVSFWAALKNVFLNLQYLFKWSNYFVTSVLGKLFVIEQVSFIIIFNYYVNGLKAKQPTPTMIHSAAIKASF